jgi:hypothetical protein
MSNINRLLEESERALFAADHMIYISFPLIKDKRLLIKAIQEIKKSVYLFVKAIIEAESFNKKVLTEEEMKSTFNFLKERITKKYGLNNKDLSLISEIFEISEIYRESSFEFMKSDRVVFLTNDLKPVAISVDKIKEFIIFSKGLLKRFKEYFKENSNTAEKKI